ncbi:helix-turn-helix transcriptional regulator [Arthrobacter sp. LjRoot14]|uniref:helix-turn-helix transcriptional regulator n=1 Tax=Arthrobacter sp. LjRoot14 TaxID=3342265 RepID=UPI003ECCE4A6
MLVGREHELEVLAGIVARGRNGSAGNLLIRGEAGVGKSALLDEVVRKSPPATVLRTQGIEVEAPLPFAALHRLLRPVTRLRQQIPPPQARALRMAFGEEDGPAVEPFLVGIATLGVLAAAAEEHFLLCVIDDAQWLDPASADALLFCSRRLGADRAVMLFAVREGTAGRIEDHGLPEMTLGGLDPGAATELLMSSGPGACAAEVADRLVSDTRGNALALLEIAADLSEAQRTGAAALPPHLHLPTRVEQVFLGRIRQMPKPVQLLLLLAAADETEDAGVIRRAADHLGLEADVFREAADSGLLILSAELTTLRHPLVRSAVYQASNTQDRRRVHLALAGVHAAGGDTERETWHRAAAADGPDPDLALALERAGLRAVRRGAHASALATYERAASLSSDPQRRAALTFAAARSAWACGQGLHARALLNEADGGAAEPGLVADIARLRGHIEVNLGSAGLAHRIFVEAARAAQHAEPLRALEMAVLAATLRAYQADSGTAFPADGLSLEPAAGDTPRTRCLKDMFAAMNLSVEGRWGEAIEAFDRAAGSSADVDDREVLWNLGNAALHLGDDEAQLHFYSGALSRAREAGAGTAVAYALQRLCFSHFLAGDAAAVRSSAEEAMALVLSIGQPSMTLLPTAWLCLLAAMQGSDEYDGLVSRLDDVPNQALGILADPVHDLTRWAKGARAVSTGDRSGALHHLSRFRLPALARMAAVERLDAAVRAGDIDRARAWTHELEKFAQATNRPWARAAAAYGRALTSDGAPADALFRESLTEYSRARRPLDEARVHLAYGEWLRRAQRRVDARHHLRLALETFRDAHTEPLAERAAQELRASGETARKRDPSTLVKLTPMELKIARLVGSGMSNKDVATECWVSPRTVAFHLRNIFSKAGITSRSELARLDLV